MFAKYEIDLSIVIPLYNEQDSLPELYAGITKHVTDMNYEILFIDDGSTDRSVQVIEKMAQQDNRVKLVQFRTNAGKSAALDAGFQAAKGGIVITMDADLQDDPAEIPELIRALEQGYDLVSGWKKKRHDPFIKRQTSKVFNYFTSLFSGIRLHDFNCGLKAYRQPVVKSMRVYGELHRYLPVIAHRNGFRVTEKVVTHHARKYGNTKFGVARFIRGAFDLLTITFLTRYKTRPLHLFGLFGITTFGVGCLLSLFLAYQRLFQGKFLSNRPLLFLGVLLIIVGIQFFSIGLLGEMLTEMKTQRHAPMIRKTIGIDAEEI